MTPTGTATVIVSLCFLIFRKILAGVVGCIPNFTVLSCSPGHMLELNVASWVCTSQERRSWSECLLAAEEGGGRHAFIQPEDLCCRTYPVISFYMSRSSSSESGVQGLRGVGGANTLRPLWQSSVQPVFVQTFTSTGTRILFSSPGGGGVGHRANINSNPWLLPSPATTWQPPVAHLVIGWKASLAVLLLVSEMGFAWSWEW